MLRPQNGASPLHLAAYKGRAAVVKLLIGRGANYRVLLPARCKPTHHTLIPNLQRSWHWQLAAQGLLNEHALKTAKF